jgi:hypothetical protein
MSLLVGLPESSGKWDRSYPQLALSSPRMLTFTQGMNNRPAMAAVLRHQSQST